MRKLWAATLALVSALAFLVIASTPANAFGSEVLGCSFDSSTWTANACYGDYPYSHISVIHFTPSNLSGTYATTWTLTTASGTALTSNCSSTTSYPCIYSGCTASSLSCDVKQRTGVVDRIVSATLRLTQSGQTRTITANATVYAGDPCPTC